MLYRSITTSNAIKNTPYNSIKANQKPIKLNLHYIVANT